MKVVTSLSRKCKRRSAFCTVLYDGMVPRYEGSMPPWTSSPFDIWDTSKLAPEMNMFRSGSEQLMDTGAEWLSGRRNVLYRFSAVGKFFSSEVLLAFAGSGIGLLAVLFRLVAAITAPRYRTGPIFNISS